MRRRIVVLVITTSILFIGAILVVLFFFSLSRSGAENKPETYTPTIGSASDPYTPPLRLRLLRPEDCDAIVRTAQAKGMSESEVRGYEKDASFRQSSTCWLDHDAHPVITGLYTALKKVTGVPKTYYEKLQVVRYHPGQFFRPHYDQCDATEAYCRDELARFGNRPRVMTFLVYLSDPGEYDGGETSFPRLDMRFKEEKGVGVLFHNLTDAWTHVHPSALHEGSPLTRGEKWIANVWLRAPVRRAQGGTRR